MQYEFQFVLCSCWFETHWHRSYCIRTSRVNSASRREYFGHDQNRDVATWGKPGGNCPNKKIIPPPKKKNYLVVTNEFLLQFNWHQNNNWPN